MVDTKPIKTGETKWITVGGKHIEVRPGESEDEAIKEKEFSLRGEKEKNTKEALSKSYVKRYLLSKSLFNPRDEVVFDEYRKSGLVAGSDGTNIRILSNGNLISVDKNSVFKKSELISGVHWDTMSTEYRKYCIEKAGIDTSYINRDWMSIQPNIRSVIQKVNGPAGYNSSSAGTNNPIYNPVNEDKTLSQRIKDEEKTQRENAGKDNEKDNDKKTRDTS